RSSSTEIHFPPLSIRRDFFAIKYEFLGHVYTLLRNSCFVGSSRNEVPPVRSAKGECCMNVMSAGRMEAVLKAAIAERDRRIADLERQLAALKKQLTAEPQNVAAPVPAVPKIEVQAPPAPRNVDVSKIKRRTGEAERRAMREKQ